MHYGAKFGDDQSNHWRFFKIFKTAAAAVLNSQNFKFLTVGRLKGVELRHHAKFGRNRSNHCRDMAIFRFFQNGGRPASWICYARVWTTHEAYLVVFISKKIWSESAF